MNQKEPQGRRRAGRRIWVWATPFLVLGLGGAAVFHFRDELSPPRAMAAEDGAVKGGTPFSDHVAKAGMTVCSSSFPAMGASLAQNSRYMVETNWNKQDPNHHLLRALVGIRFDTSDYKGPAVGVLTAAPIDGACETSAVRVTPFEMSCDEVVRRFLGGRALWPPAFRICRPTRSLTAAR